MTNIKYLPNGATCETLDDGRVLERGVDGRIRNTQLPSGLASEMGKRSARKRNDESPDIGALLDELGLESTAARLLAGQFVRGGANAVGAARTLFQMAKGGYSEGATIETAGHYITPPPGERCPRCGFYNFDGHPLVKLMELLGGGQVEDEDSGEWDDLE